MNTTNKNNCYPQSIKKESEKIRPRKSKRKRKHSSSSHKKCGKQTKNNPFSIAMSTWAQNFTMASNWQMKHELAFWKAKAKTLEYENRLLHDVIKKNYLKTDVQEGNTQEDESKAFEPQPKQTQENDIDSAEYYDENVEENIDYEENENDEFVVSEEFIEFVKANAKYKEDARRERERLRKQQDTSETIEEDNNVMTEEKLKELYGQKWDRICALEISLLTDFMNKKDNSTYWPNIPFNFS